MNGGASAAVYDFGPFRLHPGERLLLRDGKPVAVTPKVFDLLVAFVRDRGRAVPKSELLETVWPGTFVEEGSLTRTVSTLRQLLGQPGYIETVSKFGYRFTAEVRTAEASQTMAVLPFVQLGGSDAGYLSAGLADALIARLAQVRRITVRSTSAVLKYADAPPDAATAARELRVDLVLEGTIRVAGGRIRVTAQLVAGASGATVWSGRFEAAFTDLFSIEDALAEQIVAALGSETRQPAAKRQTADPEAYRLYLKGRHFWNRRTAESVQKAIGYFREAIALDARFAAAYCGLGDSYLLRAAADPAATERARAAALQALAIDESLGEAHTTLARIEMAYDWNWSAAEERFRRAVELSPEYATARQWRANLFAATGRADEAVREIEQARAADPLSPALHTASGWIHYMARRFDTSIERYREALELDPTFAAARMQIGMAYEQAGRLDEAIAAQAESRDPLSLAALSHAFAVAGLAGDARATLARLDPGRYSALLQIIAATHLALGDRTRALEYLRRACDARASTLMWLAVDPWFDAMRDEPELQAILTRIFARSA